jgi:hypothetical protein
MNDVERATLVVRHEVAVMFRRVADEQTAITRGWAEVEKAVGSLRGREFYGVFDAAKGEYRVCVQRRDDDEPAALGLEAGRFPAAVTRRYAFKGSRLRSTNSSHRRSSDSRNAPTVTRAGRASSSTVVAT